MTFVSLMNKNKSRKPSQPFVKFRKNKSGSSGGSFNQAMPFRGKSVDIEIDYDNKKIRVAEHPEGFRVDNRYGGFSCSSLIFDEVGAGRIYLTPGEDGWWYGSYGKGGNQ